MAGAVSNQRHAMHSHSLWPSVHQGVQGHLDMLQKANKVIHIEGSQATLHGSFFNNHWLAVRLTIAHVDHTSLESPYRRIFDLLGTFHLSSAFQASLASLRLC